MKASKEKIIDKIRKLLKLSESPNVNESQRAIMKAQQLAVKNGIEISHIKDEKQDAVIDCFTDPLSRIPLYQKRISTVLASNFRVLIVRERILDHEGLKLKEIMQVIGLPEDVIIYKQVYAYTIESYRLLLNAFLKDYKKRYPRRKIKQNLKNDYMIGFLSGLIYCFRQNIQEHGLMVITPQVVNDKIKQMNCHESKGRKLTRRKDYIGMNQGWRDAKKLTPHKNIGAAN